MESIAVHGCKSRLDSHHRAFIVYLGKDDLCGDVVLVRVMPPPILAAAHVSQLRWMSGPCVCLHIRGPINRAG